MADPRAVAARWPEPRIRMLAELAILLAESPWALTADHRAWAHDAGLTDEDLVHAIALGAYFGHLNRVADAVGIELDYVVKLPPPVAEPATPAYVPAPAPTLAAIDPAIALATREPTAAAIASWRAYVTTPRGPFDANGIAVVLGRVAELLGDPHAERVAPTTPLEHALVEHADAVTLTPWALGEAHLYARLRELGLPDADLFRATTLASSAGVWSRIQVALAALSRGALGYPGASWAPTKH